MMVNPSRAGGCHAILSCV